MGKFTVTHEIRCNAETFWKTFFDKTFNEKLYLEVLGFPEFKIVDQTENDQKITRVVQARPKVDMPAPIAKALGPNFGYKEEGSFDKAKQLWTWKMVPSTMAEKLRNEGAVRIEPVGTDKVRRVADILIEAKVMLIGGLMESTAEKQLRDGWDKSAVYMNKYLATPAA
jgi:hypothetical protein